MTVYAAVRITFYNQDKVFAMPWICDVFSCLVGSKDTNHLLWYDLSYAKRKITQEKNHSEE